MPKKLIFGHDKVTSGASSDIDIELATQMAKNMVTSIAGMSEDLGTNSIWLENEEEVFLG